jgi:Fur family ferric uptake transcriptional regulator
VPPTAPINGLTRAFRARGIKVTAQRKVIAEALARATNHPSATEIHASVAGRHPHISLATVYRTLRVLCDAGIAEEHDFGAGCGHYELADRPHHDHLIDAENGAIVEFCDPEIERLQKAIAARLGYRLTGYRLELFGVRADEDA